MIRFLSLFFILAMALLPVATGWRDDYLWLAARDKAFALDFLFHEFRLASLTDWKAHPFFPTGLWMFAVPFPKIFWSAMLSVVLALAHRREWWITAALLSPFFALQGGEFSFLTVLFFLSLVIQQKNSPAGIGAGLLFSAIAPAVSLPLLFSGVFNGGKQNYAALLFPVAALLAMLVVAPGLFALLDLFLLMEIRRDVYARSFFDMIQLSHPLILAAGGILAVSSLALMFMAQKWARWLWWSLAMGLLAMAGGELIFLFLGYLPYALFSLESKNRRLVFASGVLVPLLLPFLALHISMRPSLKTELVIADTARFPAGDDFRFFSARNADFVLPANLRLVPEMARNLMAMKNVSLPGYSDRLREYLKKEAELSELRLIYTGSFKTFTIIQNDGTPVRKEEPPFSRARLWLEYLEKSGATGFVTDYGTRPAFFP